MLSDCRTWCTLPAQDVARARLFYEKKLGLIPDHELHDGSTIYNAAGTRIMVFPSRVASRGHHTQLGFDVQDIRAVIRNLEALGVEFEDFPMPGFLNDGHLVNIAPYWAAWFKDSEGNSLAVWEHESAQRGIGTVSFGECTTETNLPADDMQRARKFYEERLGFSPLEEFGDGGVTYEAGKTQFIVSPTTVAPSRDHVQIAFETHRLESEMAILKEAHVLSEQAISSLWGMRAATFRDSEGNQLCLIETAPTSAG